MPAVVSSDHADESLNQSSSAADMSTQNADNAEAMLSDPADNRGLEDWSRFAGASPRTLARLFQSETGMTFRAWRQQLRLQRALEMLTEGQAVTSVALDLGYDSPSAFIAMFRRALGAYCHRFAALEIWGRLLNVFFCHGMCLR